MFHNKSLTICNQQATQNVINGNHNSIKLADSQGIVVTIAGNGNEIYILNTSIRLAIFGSNNLIKTLNANTSLSLNGNSNAVYCKSSSLEVINNSGMNNKFENIVDQVQYHDVRASVAESQIELVARSHVQPAITQEVRVNEEVMRQVGNRERVVHHNQNQTSEMRSPQKCSGFKKFLQFFGCVGQRSTNPSSNRNRSRSQRPNSRPPQVVPPVAPERVQNNPNNINNRNKKQNEGLNDQQLDKLFSNIVQNNNAGQCLICLTDIQVDQYQTYLLCFHRFHTKCIKQWLKKSTICPLCNTNQKEYLQ